MSLPGLPTKKPHFRRTYIRLRLSLGINEVKDEETERPVGSVDEHFMKRFRDSDTILLCLLALFRRFLCGWNFVVMPHQVLPLLFLLLHCHRWLHNLGSLLQLVCFELLPCSVISSIIPTRGAVSCGLCGVKPREQSDSVTTSIVQYISRRADQSSTYSLLSSHDGSPRLAMVCE